jgi:hypothetical protein
MNSTPDERGSGKAVSSSVDNGVLHHEEGQAYGQLQHPYQEVPVVVTTDVAPVLQQHQGQSQAEDDEQQQPGFLNLLYDGSAYLASGVYHGGEHLVTGIYHSGASIANSARNTTASLAYSAASLARNGATSLWHRTFG